MTEHDPMRRALVAGGALAAGALAVAGAAADVGEGGVRPRPRQLDLADPRERARIRAKVSGSTIEEIVYTLYRLHLYLFTGEGNLQPMLTMSNLSATRWRPLPSGNFAGTVYEVGVYTKFDTDELTETWHNPVTGEDREVWQFVGGPLGVEIGPDGVVTGAEATVKPQAMRMEVIGDLVMVPSQSAFSFPNRLDPAVWKKEWSGPRFYWDSHFVQSARVEEVADPKVTRANAFCQFQNLVSWHPWLGMGQSPGRTYGKAYGAKLAGLGQLPPAVRANLEKKTPEIFDLEGWKTPRIDFADYVRARKPG